MSEIQLTPSQLAAARRMLASKAGASGTGKAKTRPKAHYKRMVEIRREKARRRADGKA